MRRIVFNKNIDKRKYYEILITIDNLLGEYHRYLSLARRAKTSRIRKTNEDKAKTYYENEVEPYLQWSSERFDLPTEEILNDIPNVDYYC